MYRTVSTPCEEINRFWLLFTHACIERITRYNRPLVLVHFTQKSVHYIKLLYHFKRLGLNPSIRMDLYNAFMRNGVFQWSNRNSH